MTPVPLIFAFGFGNFAMLGWLAAAAAPIVIHLWSRRRYREAPWAAMEYLLAAIRRSSRRLRIEQWLLLLLRTLIIVLVVLAVAEPYRQGAGLVLPSNERTHRVLVIDASYSMDYKPGNVTRFEQAKQLAAQIAEESGQGDGLSLVLAAAPPQVIVGRPTLDSRTILPEIASLSLQQTTADWPATLAKVEEVLQNARRECPRLVRQQVYIFTDLCRVGWRLDPADRAATNAFRDRARRLAQSAESIIIDLGQADADNLAVVQIRTDAAYATPGRPVAAEAQIRDFGHQAHPGQSVELFVDGRRVEGRQVDIPPGGSVAVSLSHSFDAPGEHVLEVRAPGDRLSIDNRRWLVLTVKPHLSVLCIDGRPSGQQFGGATSYLRVALAPEANETAGGAVQVQAAPESAILERSLAQYDCVFLADVAQFTAGEAHVLERYVEVGGGLVFFLGERVLADRWNRELAGEGPNAVDLLPARLGSLVETSAEGPLRLDPLDYRHPIVQAFHGQERAGLLTTPITKYIRLDVASHAHAQVALAAANGDPLIVEQAVGRGRVILMATSADTAWTPMPLWPSYVPIVQELLAYAVAGQMKGRNVEIGQPLEGSTAATAGDDHVIMQTPDGRSEQIRLHAQGDRAEWSFTQTIQGGIYTARYGASGQASPFAVNLDTVESDLAKLTPGQFREQVWPGVPFTYQTHWAEPDQRPLAGTGQRGSLSGGLLQLALGLLLLETFLAWRFGHQTL